ncbi:MAG: alpha/beta hydrolase [Muribaculaceae bacterium]|nr:alpha/beta hydrolase [Muribaculaceae bacterium]
MILKKLFIGIILTLSSFLNLSAETKKIEVTENIPYRTDVGASTLLDLAQPLFGNQSNRPVILIIHGGGWSAGSKDDMVYRALMIDYALQGYVVANMNYRLIQESPMPACIEDVRTAVRWLKAHSYELGINPEKIGVFGHSAGGHLALMVGLHPEEGTFENETSPYIEYDSGVACAVGGAPPTEIGNPDIPWARHPEWWPIGYINQIQTPILVLQGDEDPIVKPHLTEDWVRKMKEAGSEVDYLKIKGDHSIAFDRALEITRPVMDSFFQKHLKSENH